MSADKPNSSGSKTKSEAKSESSKEATKKTDSSSDNTPKSKEASPKISKPNRPTSYFSSVSTNEYREGWTAIFSDNSGNTTDPIKQKVSGKRKQVSITLTNSDLNNDLKNLLKESIRSRAKKDGLKIGRALANESTSWRIICKFD